MRQLSERLPRPPELRIRGRRSLQGFGRRATGGSFALIIGHLAVNGPGNSPGTNQHCFFSLPQRKAPNLGCYFRRRSCIVKNYYYFIILPPHMRGACLRETDALKISTSASRNGQCVAPRHRRQMCLASSLTKLLCSNKRLREA